MARGPRISFSNAVYHVLNRFVDKHPFFVHDADYRIFLDIYFETAALCKIRTFAYCLMPNHFPFCIQTPEANISQFLSRFLTRACQTLNRAHDRTGHLLQGVTKTLLIEEACYFETVVGYVLLNSVRAGLATNFTSYKWGSGAESVRNVAARIDRHALAERITGKQFALDDIAGQCASLEKWALSLDHKSVASTFESAHRGSFLSTSIFRRKVLLETERRAKLGPDCNFSSAAHARR